MSIRDNMQVTEDVISGVDSQFVARGVVKSVQKGRYLNSIKNVQVTEASITISSINMQKSIVLLNCTTSNRPPAESSSYTYTPSGYLNSSTELKLYRTGVSGNYSSWSNINWQVIEFY